jgi:hypothetical protein
VGVGASVKVQLRTTVSVSRSEAVQAAGDQVQPWHNAERRRVLRLSGGGEPRGEEARPRGDQQIGEQALPDTVQGRRMPIQSSLFVLSGSRGGDEVVRDGAQAGQRQDVR